MKNHKIKVIVDKKQLLSALDRAALVTEEKIAGSVRSHVKLEIAENAMKISAVSTAGSTYDELNVEHDGDNITIAFNNRYLIDSIKACESESIVLTMSTALTSMNIEPTENDYEQKGSDEIFMLLPVRTKD